MRIIGIGAVFLLLGGCCCLLGAFNPPPQEHHIVCRQNSRAHANAIPIRRVPPGFFFVGSIDLGPDETDVPALTAYYGADAYSINRDDPFGPGVYLFRARDLYEDTVATMAIRLTFFMFGCPFPTPSLFIRRNRIVIPEENVADFNDPDEVCMLQPIELTLSPFGLAFGQAFGQALLWPWTRDSGISVRIYAEILGLEWPSS